MVIAAKISSKRQITLPLKIMVRLNLNPGDQLVFEERNGHIEVKPQSEKFSIRDFVKKHRGKVSKKLSDEEIRKARQEAWQEGEN